ncbi:hypothetical protein Syun_002593 [Stephania yunnanensis]|uniref:non-specific serine/threonine protein kinase n=1 Tax=Stephania yunnanensis TaxID=152371 RepID=A0AAP0Q866_9MAGN
MASSSEEAPPTPEDLLSDELHRLSFTSATTSTTTNTTTPTDIHRSTSSGSSSTTTTWTSSSKPQYSTASSDPCWDSLRRLRSSPSNGGSAPLSFSDLQFLHRLGSGDIGSVYLAELRNSPDCAFFAAKIMDKKELESRNKEGRARTEREILQLLDHPFLPTLYACLESTRWFCLLTDFCPGGDLHVLRQRQPGKRFHESAVRFYASELW